MAHTAIVVFTARGLNRILREGGSQAWRLRQENAAGCEYLVCTQNRHNGPWGEADAEHASAFLVGKIRDIVLSTEGGKSEGRWLIRISSYATIHKPDCWKGLRNPVRYCTLEDLGIDPNKLVFQQLPDPRTLPPSPKAIVSENENSDAEGLPRPLTIAEAKMGLALGLGVPESTIEIQVRY